ncbi:hypothetical protein ACJMK2_006765 [Sinanodonta woodiana]|uniref:Uncharacterized protein n=1 Tax=Sinanodonta woodiana TaxID=1069815 RepID=A0ABD3VU56_SINWO
MERSRSLPTSLNDAMVHAHDEKTAEDELDLLWDDSPFGPGWNDKWGHRLEEDKVSSIANRRINIFRFLNALVTPLRILKKRLKKRRGSVEHTSLSVWDIISAVSDLKKDESKD